jgi:hypothetical protein
LKQCSSIGWVPCFCRNHNFTKRRLSYKQRIIKNDNEDLRRN